MKSHKRKINNNIYMTSAAVEQNYTTLTTVKKSNQLIGLYF